jgi:hypothetical protein
MLARVRTHEELDRPPTGHEPREIHIRHARRDIARMPGIPRLDVGLHPSTVEVMSRSVLPLAPGSNRHQKPGLARLAVTGLKLLRSHSEGGF